MKQSLAWLTKDQVEAFYELVKKLRKIVNTAVLYDWEKYELIFTPHDGISDTIIELGVDVEWDKLADCRDCDRVELVESYTDAVEEVYKRVVAIQEALYGE